MNILPNIWNIARVPEHGGIQFVQLVLWHSVNSFSQRIFLQKVSFQCSRFKKTGTHFMWFLKICALRDKFRRFHYWIPRTFFFQNRLLPLKAQISRWNFFLLIKTKWIINILESTFYIQCSLPIAILSLEFIIMETMKYSNMSRTLFDKHLFNKHLTWGFGPYVGNFSLIKIVEPENFSIFLHLIHVTIILIKT